MNSLIRKQLPSAQKGRNSMNVSRSFFVFGMDSALAFHGIMFYETEETAPQSSWKGQHLIYLKRALYCQHNLSA